MAFAVPEGLAPEVYPLAWLLGTWRGPGFVAYPDISERPFVQEVTFAHDGGPYLTYTSTIWLLEEVEDADGAADLTTNVEGTVGTEGTEGGPVAGDDDPPTSSEVRYVPGVVWAAESGYWRAAPRAASQGSATDAPGRVAPTEIEVLLAEPSGHVSVYLGAVQGPRIEIATDLIARTATAADVSAISRMYGLVGGELMWAMDMAAFGHELQSYASARLSRLGETGA